MQFIQLGQQAPVGVGVLAGKAIARAGTGLQLPVLELRFGQPLHLYPRIATHMDQKAEHFPFIGLRQGVIGQPDEGAADKIIPI